MSEILEEQNIATLRPAARNPRIATDRFSAKLKTSLQRFGDLGCIILNETTGNLIGGTQRSQTMMADPTAKLYKTTIFAEASAVGTVAEGHLDFLSEHHKVRWVVWTEPFEKAARVAANALHAEWDTTMLGEEVRELIGLDADLARLTSFDDDQLKVLADGGMIGEKPDGKMDAKPKQIRYTREELEAHKQRYLSGQVDQSAAVVLDAFMAFIAAGEPSAV